MGGLRPIGYLYRAMSDGGFQFIGDGERTGGDAIVVSRALPRAPSLHALTARLHIGRRFRPRSITGDVTGELPIEVALR